MSFSTNRMKVCYFGIYDREYSRNKILISGLKQNDVEVFECISNKTGLSKYLDLIKKHRALKGNYDVMVVGYPGFQAMILAKFLTSKPIIFDAFVSIYDSMVLDRAQVKKNSLRALYFWYLDKLSLTLADIVLFDTNEHINFVSKEFKIKANKFRRIFVGADTNIFYPKEKKETGIFKVLFYGHFIPLQGVDSIVRAAKLLEEKKDIFFEIIGDGQEKEKIVQLSKNLNIENVNFIGNVSLEELSRKISEANVCLGIFGSTEKAKRVIPNKVYECVAIAKPVITSDTRAVREIFTEEELFLVPISSPESISKAILLVKSDTINANLKGKRAYEKLLSTASVKILGKELSKIISTLT